MNEIKEIDYKYYTYLNDLIISIETKDCRGIYLKSRLILEYLLNLFIKRNDNVIKNMII